MALAALSGLASSWVQPQQIKWAGPSVVLAYLLVGMALFAVVYSSSVLPGMVPWFVILISELKFRRQNPEIMRSHPFKLPLYPYSNYFSIGLLIIILFFMFINPDTRVSVSIGVVFLLLVSCMYWVKKKRGTV